MKNEKCTFSVLFYLKKDKMKKNGLVPIHARVSDLPIRQINKVFIENFYLYIIKNHDCSPNTAMKFI